MNYFNYLKKNPTVIIKGIFALSVIIISIVMVMIFTFMPLYESIEDSQKRQLLNKPMKISESDGIILWKIEDSTPGGKSYIYYTSKGEILDK